ncbi:MAG: queuosine precursor transporter [Alphaproteobacteria bacterium]|nr:queuosine precursor transporter [Alphaproteobacteria bacterium]MDE2340067.1 queuosine precursor transporter [Alphaproteobacteria bacterium]
MNIEAPPHQLPHVVANSLHGRPLKYFDFVMAASVLILVLSNVIGASKSAMVTLPLYGELKFGAGVMFFPLGYLLGDVLTEVYGYARARRCIWAGFTGLAFMVFMASVVVALPPAKGWSNQAAYETVFGQEWRIALASLLAFWAGDFVNCFVLAQLKLLTQGKWLWTRTIGSTVCGQAVDSIIFYPLAFWDAPGFTHALVGQIAIANWTLKVIWEVLLTPLTYGVVGFLKRAEGLDVYDEGTNFTPFRTGL